MKPALLLPALLLLGSVLACGEPDTAVPEAVQPETDTLAARSSSGWIYERNFVFTTVALDTTYLAPWLFRTRTRPGAVERGTHGWLTRDGEWEHVVDDRWETPPSRAPWRILPHGDLRLVVGAGDAVESLLYAEGPRKMELELGAIRMEWTASDGEVLRLLDAALFLGDEEVPGMVLDMARTTRADGPTPGDWAFLVSGDSLQVVLESPRIEEPGTAGAVRGWARLAFRDLRWPGLTMDWAEVRPYPPARRDIPVAWDVRGPDGEVAASLRATSTWARALEGPGPLLPVEALFEVSGTLSVEGGNYPVRGVVRHVRP